MSQSYPSASQGSQRQVTQGTAQPSVSLQKYSSQPLLRVKNGQEKSFSNLTNSLQRLMPPCNCSKETNHKVESLCNRIVGIAEDISQMKTDLGHLKDHSPALEDSLPVAQSSKKRTSTAKRKRPTKGKQHKIDEYTSFHLPADTNFPSSLIESGAADVDASFCTK
ncbi:unnamed protein product [Closterium sp. Yama58-4]|nr:unnamed protein product [Closterium sp. Yama58-4]